MSQESRAAYARSKTYALGFQAVREKAPRASGVYTIYSAQRWLHVGASDDIQQSLFEVLNEPSACMERRGPLSFSFEVVPAAHRTARQQALLAWLMPICDSASPESGHSVAPVGEESGPPDIKSSSPSAVRS